MKKRFFIIFGTVTIFIILLLIILIIIYNKLSIFDTYNKGIKINSMELNTNNDFYEDSIVHDDGVLQKVNIDEGSLNLIDEPIVVDEFKNCIEENDNNSKKFNIPNTISCGSKYRFGNKFMKLSPDGNYLAVLKTINSNFDLKYSRNGAKNASIYIYDMKSGEKKEVVETFEDVVVTSISWGLDGKSIVFSTDNDYERYFIDMQSEYKQNVGFHMVNVETGERISNISKKLVIGQYEILYYKDNNYYVLAGDSIVKIDLWEKPSYEINNDILGYGYFLSPDYKKIALLDVSGFKIFNLEKMEYENVSIPETLNDYLWDFNEIAFNHDGSMVSFVGQKGNHPEGYFDGVYSHRLGTQDYFTLLNIERNGYSIKEDTGGYSGNYAENRPVISISYSSNDEYFAISEKLLNEKVSDIYFYNQKSDYPKTTVESYSVNLDSPIDTSIISTEYDEFLNLR